MHNAPPAIHLPVLLNEVLEILVPTGPGLLVDATIGLGGHAAALLDACPGFQLLGLDRDRQAIRHAGERLCDFGGRVSLVERRFADLVSVLQERQAPAPVAILADLGCSSLQLDSAERGFSFQKDGPLDMRMGRSSAAAADLVNTADPEELMRVLWKYGEERRARAITRAIIERRQQQPLQTTGELSRLLIEVLGWRRQDRIHPATRTFQALRIAVNDELGQLERFLEPAVRALRPGGRLCVISFHSLEDRIVKHTLRRLEGRCTCPPDLPRCACQPEQVVRVLNRRPIRAAAAEVEANPRSRSARLRAAERLEKKP